MQISTTRRLATPQLGVSPKPAPSQEQVGESPADAFTFSDGTKSRAANVIKTVGAIAFGASVGVWAGYNSGALAGLGGAAVTVVPGAFAGGVSAALIAERLGQPDSSTVAGAGIWGAVLGGAAGATGGAFLGSQMAGIAAATGLGVIGGVTGLLIPS